MTLGPADDDVVVRLKSLQPAVVYVIGTFAAPDQIAFSSRSDAVDAALDFARVARVGAWSDAGDGRFEALGPPRATAVTRAKRSA